MKNFRRQPKKRSRARTFDELESAFYGLVLKHNQLLQSHRKLELNVAFLESKVNDLEPREYDGIGYREMGWD